MCTDTRGVPNRGDRNQEQGEEDDNNPDLTEMSPPLWTPAAAREGEEDEEQVEVDTQMGYHPIRDETPSTTLAESVDSGSPAGNGVVSGHHANGSGMNELTVSNVHVSNGENSQERIVTVNGMEFHVYGNVSGLELLSLSDREESLHLPDSDEEEEEERRRVEAERAVLEANRAHEARRAAPIPPEHRTRILNAMKGIDLGGFRPAWADSVPEEQWIERITSRGNSST